MTKRVEGTDIYFAQFGTSSLLLPALFGIPGALVVKSKTARMADPFSAGGTFDLRQRASDTLARVVAASVGAGGSQGSAQYEISPALLVQAGSDGKVRSALLFRAQAAAERWTGVYFYHLDYTSEVAMLDKERIADFFAGVEGELDAAFATLGEVMTRDLSNRSSNETPVQARSKHFGNLTTQPFRAFESRTEGGRPVLRIGQPALVPLPFVVGVHVFGADQVTIER